MGVVKNITANSFPQQSIRVGKKARLCFHFDTSEQLVAEIVRDDAEDPFVTIFRTEGGRHILATECQYQFL